MQYFAVDFILISFMLVGIAQDFFVRSTWISSGIIRRRTGNFNIDLYCIFFVGAIIDGNGGFASPFRRNDNIGISIDFQFRREECSIKNRYFQFAGILSEVFDGDGALCITEIVGLKKAEAYAGAPIVHSPVITVANPMPPDLNEEPPFPCLSTSFSRYLNCYSIRKQGTGLVYALDLNEKNTDAHGFAHTAAMFTVADSAVCGSLVRIEKKNPVTVSASMRYLAKAETSLVEARPRLTRSGRVLYFYDVDIVDGNGTLAAVGQFVIQSLEK